MSLEKVQIPSERPIYPTPAGLVTTVDADGKANIITLGEIYNLSIRKPVIVGLGIAPQRYDAVGFAMIEKIWGIGSAAVQQCVPQDP